MEFVPVIGPLAAALICIGVAGLSGYSHLLLLIGFIALYRLFQDYVLNPYLMSDGVEISPLLVLFGILAGEELAGMAGIFLSVPVIAAGKIFALRIVQARKLETSIPSSPVARLLSASAQLDGTPTLGEQPDALLTARVRASSSRRRSGLRWLWSRSNPTDDGRT